MKNKFWSLMIVFIVYVLAAISGGVVVYYGAPFISSGLLLIFIADCVATFVVFLFSLIFKNASVYDPYWSVAPVFIIIGFYYVLEVSFSVLHLIVLIPLAVWSVRLTYNWIGSFDNLTWQDWRYTDIKQKFPKSYLFINFTGIMLVPTILVFAGLIPLYYMLSGTANLIALIIGGSIILFAAVYQATADAQLHKFLQNPHNQGKCMSSGLWSLSRHPNYFAEISVWFGVFVSSLPNLNWLTPLGCILILCLFVFISVPLMENHMLKHNQQYADYKKIVPSPLVPFRSNKQIISNQATPLDK